MKKITFSLALLMTSAAAIAAPVGNPSFPRLIRDGYFLPCDSWIDFRLGYEGDFVGDARLKQRVESSGRVDDYRQDTNSGTATLNFLDRLDLYGVFGSSRTCSDWRFSTATGGTNRAVVETKYNFLWAVGGRGVLYEWGCTILGLGGRYTQTNAKPAWLTINGAPAPVAGTHLHWREWQIDLDLSHQIEIFIPYIGIKYSNVKTRIGNFSVPISSNGSGTIHMSNRTPVGLLIGCTLTTGKFFMLNLEGRLIDEEAATISGDIRF